MSTSAELSTKENIESLIDELGSNCEFDQNKHDSEAKLSITILFICLFFVLIIFVFLFCGGYNYFAMKWVHNCIETFSKTGKPIEYCKINYLDTANITSLVVNGLGSILGFIIGYYFKPKD